jgi:D-alanyl-D-alanine carboxypeptidase/D-alanyl-D-alanine-endopeptidase (penicillin-binding protein 4)
VDARPGARRRARGLCHIKGSGDPKLVLERLWLLLRRLQQMGVREIRGDIVLDGSAFAVPDGRPADFDGEPLRPYNVRPAALLLNFAR